MAQARVKARRRATVFGGERFALFAETLLTGVWIAVACLGLVTYPAAFAAGARHLRRRTGHEAGGWREFVADFRTAVRRGWLVGIAGWVAAAAGWVDVQAARAGIPGGPLVGAVGLFALIGLAVAGLRAAAVWSPGASWRAPLADAVRPAPRGRPPAPAPPRRVLPDRRRPGRRGPVRGVHRAAGGPGPRGRRGGGRRRGGA